MDAESLAGMTVEELAAAREQASEEEKAAIDAELAKRQEGGSDNEEGETEMKADPETDLPYGATVLASAITALETATADIIGAAKKVEHPEVKAQLDTLSETMEGTLAGLRETYSSSYPDAPPLAGGEGEVEPTTDEAVLKSFVALGRDRQMRGAGLLRRLEAAVSMSPRVRAAAEPALKSLRAIVTQAKKPSTEIEQAIAEVRRLKSIAANRK